FTPQGPDGRQVVTAHRSAIGEPNVVEALLARFFPVHGPTKDPTCFPVGDDGAASDADEEDAGRGRLDDGLQTPALPPHPPPPAAVRARPVTSWAVPPIRTGLPSSSNIPSAWASTTRIDPSGRTMRWVTWNGLFPRRASAKCRSTSSRSSGCTSARKARSVR